MSHHEGVSCDSCLKGNFRGRRYKCLICFDFDQCSTCFESSATSPRHTSDHPMQCILTRADYELFYAGESVGLEQPQSYTCPYCSKMGFTDVSLHEHVSSEHVDTSIEVICPICASLPGGEPNNVTDDFATHLTLEHRSPRELEESNNGVTTAIRGRRAPHPNRSMHSSRTSRRNQTQYPTSNSGLAPLSSANGSSTMAAATSASGGLSALTSPGNRDAMDPIAELLSQLSGVRRTAPSHANHLQQLQMQLQLERQQPTSSQLLSSIHPSQGLSINSTSAPVSGSVGLPPSAASRSAALYSQVAQSPIERVMRRHHQQQQFQQQQNSNHIPYSFQSHINGLSGVSVSGHPLAAAAPVPPSGHVNLIPGTSIGLASAPNIGLGYQNFSQTSNPSGGSVTVSGIANPSPTSRFLLSQCEEGVPSESELTATEVLRADKSLFIQELLISTLSVDITNLNQEEEISHEQSDPQRTVVEEAAPEEEAHMPPSEGEIRRDSTEQKTESIGGSSDVIDRFQTPTNDDSATDENLGSVGLSAATCVVKIRSNQNETPILSPSSALEPLSQIANNFFPPPAVAHPLVGATAVVTVTSRGTSPSAWTSNASAPLRTANVRRSNSGSSNTGPTHPMKRGPPPPPTIAPVAAQSSGTSNHRHES